MRLNEDTDLQIALKELRSERQKEWEVKKEEEAKYRFNKLINKWQTLLYPLSKSFYDKGTATEKLSLANKKISNEDVDFLILHKRDIFQSLNKRRTLSSGSSVSIEKHGVDNTVACLRDIKVLNLENNPLGQFHEKLLALFGADQMVSLNVSRCQLSSLPDCFKYFVSLKEVDLSSNEFKVFPTLLCDLILKQLERIDLSSNNLTEVFIAEKHDNFTRSKLRVLNLSNNKLSQRVRIHSSSLKKLYLSNNQISKTAAFSINEVTDLEISGFVLEELDMGFNSLEVLPSYLKNLLQLNVLNLNNNKITQLDFAVLKEMVSLKRLSLDFNRVDFVPEWITTLKNLDHLSLFANLLVFPFSQYQITKGSVRNEGNPGFLDEVRSYWNRRRQLRERRMIRMVVDAVLNFLRTQIEEQSQEVRCVSLPQVNKEKMALHAYFDVESLKSFTELSRVNEDVTESYKALLLSPSVQYFAMDIRFLLLSVQEISKFIPDKSVRKKFMTDLRLSDLLSTFKDSFGPICFFNMVVPFEECNCAVTCTPFQKTIKLDNQEDKKGWLCMRRCVMLREPLNYVTSLLVVNERLMLEERKEAASWMILTTKDFLNNGAGKPMMETMALEKLKQLLSANESLSKINKHKAKYSAKVGVLMTKHRRKFERIKKNDEATLEKLYTKKKRLLAQTELFTGSEEEELLAKVEALDAEIEEMKQGVDIDELNEKTQAKIVKFRDRIVKKVLKLLDLKPIEEEQLIRMVDEPFEHNQEKSKEGLLRVDGIDIIGFDLKTDATFRQLRSSFFQRLLKRIKRKKPIEVRYKDEFDLILKFLREKYVSARVAEERKRVEEKWKAINQVLNRWCRMSLKKCFQGWRKQVNINKTVTMQNKENKQINAFMHEANSIGETISRQQEKQKWVEYFDEIHQKSYWQHYETGEYQYQPP